jgi:tRNA pseudouridine38-40 synthase
MPNIRLTLAYDGTAFCGWQVQPDARTVQGVLQSAIESLTGERVNLLSAGRTDSGVHALGQVANFVTGSTIPAEKWRAALQGKLPADVVILDSREVPAEFHATYSAVRKRYRYLIRQSLIDDPFVGRYVWRIGGELDVDAMNAAARLLLGKHDFRCFETEWPNKATSVRTIQHAEWSQVERWPGWSTSGALGATGLASANQESPVLSNQHGQSPWHPPQPEFLSFEIEADGFLYNMVRAIVGTLVNVGRGKWPVDCVSEIIAGQDRSTAGETAPAHGLYLVRVNYPSLPDSRPAASP